jgi:hypothetical protein
VLSIRPIVRHDVPLQYETQTMFIPLRRPASALIGASEPGRTWLLIGWADLLLRRLIHRPPLSSSLGRRARRPAAEEVEFRNELVARLGKAD